MHACVCGVEFDTISAVSVAALLIIFLEEFNQLELSAQTFFVVTFPSLQRHRCLLRSVLSEMGQM